MNDDTVEEPIDLSLKHEPRSHQVHSVQQSTDHSTHPRQDHNVLSSTTNHPLELPTETTSSVFEGANVLSNPLLSYFLLTENTSTNMQQLLQLFSIHMASVKEASKSRDTDLHTREQVNSHLCRADTTRHMDDDEDDDIDTNLHLTRYLSRNNHLTATSHHRGHISRTMGRPLTGRYVRNGTGASESTLAQLRRTIEWRMSRRDGQSASKERRHQKKSKKHIVTHHQVK